MLDILDDEEDAHRKGEKSDKADADFETKALVEFCLVHRPFIRSEAPPIEGGAKPCSWPNLVEE
jgi:hypothetical protein